LTVLVGQQRLNIGTVALISCACECMDNTQRKQHHNEHNKYTLNTTHNEHNTLRNQRNTQGTQHSINTTKQTHNTQWTQRTTTPNYNKFTINSMTQHPVHCLWKIRLQLSCFPPLLMETQPSSQWRVLLQTICRTM